MIPHKTQRGIDVVRKLAGMGHKVIAPHAAYMKITTLELEKVRLNNTKEHVLRRSRDIDERLRQIEEQKDALLRNIERNLGSEQSRPDAHLATKMKGLKALAGGTARLTY
jgi:hypothetical protein